MNDIKYKYLLIDMFKYLYYIAKCVKAKNLGNGVVWLWGLLQLEYEKFKYGKNKKALKIIKAIINKQLNFEYVYFWICVLQTWLPRRV